MSEVAEYCVTLLAYTRLGSWISQPPNMEYMKKGWVITMPNDPGYTQQPGAASGKSCERRIHAIK